MNIIKGINYHKKNIYLSTHIPSTCTIITENVEYVEDLLLKTHPVLIDIEVMTLTQFQRQLLLEHQLFERRVINDIELTYYLRLILKYEEFHCFRWQENPYSLITQIIQTLRTISYHHLDLYPDTSNTLTLQKFEDIRHILKSLRQYMDKNTYLSLTEACMGLSYDKKLIVLGDDYTNLYDIAFFNQYDCDVLISANDSTHISSYLLNYYSGDTISYPDIDDTVIQEKLFGSDQCDRSHLTGYKIIGGSLLQECMKVACDIQYKLVEENLRYQDFMIIIPDEYEKMMTRILDNMKIPHDNTIVQENFYQKDFKKLMRATMNSDAKTFHEFVLLYESLSLEKETLRYISHFDTNEEINKNEMWYFLQATYPDQKTIFPMQDVVLIRKMDKCTRINTKYIYVMGLNEGTLPKTINERGILLEIDYASLKRKPYSLYEQLGKHYNDIIKCLLMPGTFIFSYSLTTNDGDELMPSTLMKQLECMYDLKECIYHLDLYKPHLYLHSYVPESRTYSILHDYLSTHNHSERIKEEYRDMLGKGMSVSRIETYNKCPYQYFLKYGLNIYKTYEDILQPSELGSLAHYILETSLEDFDVIKHGNEYIYANLKEKYKRSLMNQYILDQLVKDMNTIVHVVVSQIEGSSFEVLETEKKITGKIGDIHVGGIIDRVDTFENALRIIDYKSSEKDIDISLAKQGFNIQMLVYLYLLSQEIENNASSVLYFCFKRHLIKAKDYVLSQSFNEQDVLFLYKMKGYLFDNESYDIINHSLDGSIPANLKKDGTPAKNAHCLPHEELESIINDINDHITSLYNDLREGHVPITPANSTDKTLKSKVYPCTYCDYSTVCLYDIFENDYKEIKKDGDENA